MTFLLDNWEVPQAFGSRMELDVQGPAGFGDVGRGSAGYGGYGGPASASMATKYSSQMASGYGDSSGRLFVFPSITKESNSRFQRLYILFMYDKFAIF